MEWFLGLGLALWYQQNQKGRGGVTGTMDVNAPIASNNIQEQQAHMIGQENRFGRQPVYYNTAWRGKQTELARQVNHSPLANKFINNAAYVHKYNELQAEGEELADERIAINLDPLFVQIRSPSIPVEVAFRNQMQQGNQGPPGLSRKTQSSATKQMYPVYNPGKAECLTFDQTPVGVY